MSYRMNNRDSIIWTRLSEDDDIQKGGMDTKLI